MPNMQNTKVPMPTRDAVVRGRDFNEVETGYELEHAQLEAQRCLNCKNKPCVEGCPVEVDIPGFILCVANGDVPGAFEILSAENALPAICGRVCPQETQCEIKCVRAIKGEPVGVGRLERFTADEAVKLGIKPAPPPPPNGKRMAIVGAGPAGLTCAGELARMGYKVTLMEALHLPGGVLMYGIPEFRLPKGVVQREIDGLRELGVEILTNVIVGKTFTIHELLAEGYEAVFIGTGAGLPSFLGIPGENLIGVYSSNEFLTRINLMKAYREDYDTPIQRVKNVCVVGGGNVAMDAARSALRLGAEKVTIVYRRGQAELPARLDEVHHAMEEGINFHFLTAPTAILGDDKGYVSGMECLKMELGEPDDSGRRRPVEIKGSEFVIPCEQVVVAIGQTPNPLLREATPGLEFNRWGCVETTGAGGQTTLPGVYAGGDIVTGAATVILAMGAGKEAARAMDEYSKSK